MNLNLKANPANLNHVLNLVHVLLLDLPVDQVKRIFNIQLTFFTGKKKDHSDDSSESEESHSESISISESESEDSGSSRGSRSSSDEGSEDKEDQDAAEFKVILLSYIVPASSLRF